MKHPAPYSPAILAAIGERIPPHSLVLDPFAGTGLIHTLASVERDIITTGVELEPEWATMHEDTVQGDATNLPIIWAGAFDVVATSPCYGNRMADHHNATDTSKRITYRHVLGRMPSDRSSAVMQWGPEYRDLHERAWREAWRVTRRHGLLLLNVKDHIRRGWPQNVPEWHKRTCKRIGYALLEEVRIPAAGMRFGQNGQARIDHEVLYVMEKT